MQQVRAGLEIAGALFVLVLLSALPAAAETIAFGAGWQSLTFRGIAKTEYDFQNDELVIRAPQSSSVIYRAVPEKARGAKSAHWRWQVDASVPPTDLSQKGGEDRNIALYFVFTDADTLRRAGQRLNIRSLLTSSKARILIYIFGGQHKKGSFIPSPYFQGRGVNIIKRSAGAGAYVESADLRADYVRAFDQPPGLLAGVAVSSDSDDTGVLGQARLGAIRLE